MDLILAPLEKTCDCFYIYVYAIHVTFMHLITTTDKIIGLKLNKIIQNKVSTALLYNSRPQQ